MNPYALVVSRRAPTIHRMIVRLQIIARNDMALTIVTLDYLPVILRHSGLLCLRSGQCRTNGCDDIIVDVAKGTVLVAFTAKSL
jgi:hypothetical protein